MKKEYKKIYSLVLSLGYSPAYIHNKNGLFSLEVFPRNFNLYENSHFKFNAYDLQKLEEEIKIVLEEDLKRIEKGDKEKWKF